MGVLISPDPQAKNMRIQFEIREKLSEIIDEILNCERWTTVVKEDISGRKVVVIRDQSYDSKHQLKFTHVKFVLEQRGPVTSIVYL